MKAAPVTAKGRQARETITAAAARLMHERGIAATTLDDVLSASGTGKSQLYHYFGDKDGLTAAVLEHQFRCVMAAQPALSDEARPDLLRWREEVLAAQRASGFGRCPLGSFAGQVDGSPELRETFSRLFEQWRSALATLVRRARDAGRLPTGTDPDDAGLTLLAALQGGTLLANLQGSSHALERALDEALGRIGGLGELGAEGPGGQCRAPA